MAKESSVRRLQETAFLPLPNVAKVPCVLVISQHVLTKLISNQKDRIMITFSRGTDKALTLWPKHR